MQSYQTHNNYVLKLIIRYFSISEAFMPYALWWYFKASLRHLWGSDWETSSGPSVPSLHDFSLATSHGQNGQFHISYGLLVSISRVSLQKWKAVPEEGKGHKGCFQEYFLLDKATSTCSILSYARQHWQILTSSPCCQGNFPSIPCLCQILGGVEGWVPLDTSDTS